MKDNVSNCTFQNCNKFLCPLEYRPNKGIYQKISGGIKHKEKIGAF